MTEEEEKEIEEITAMIEKRFMLNIVAIPKTLATWLVSKGIGFKNKRSKEVGQD